MILIRTPEYLLANFAMQWKDKFDNSGTDYITYKLSHGTRFFLHIITRFLCSSSSVVISTVTGGEDDVKLQTTFHKAS